MAHDMAWSDTGAVAGPYPSFETVEADTALHHSVAPDRHVIASRSETYSPSIQSTGLADAQATGGQMTESVHGVESARDDSHEACSHSLWKSLHWRCLEYCVAIIR